MKNLALMAGFNTILKWMYCVSQAACLHVKGRSQWRSMSSSAFRGAVCLVRCYCLHVYDGYTDWNSLLTLKPAFQRQKKTRRLEIAHVVSGHETATLHQFADHCQVCITTTVDDAVAAVDKQTACLVDSTRRKLDIPGHVAGFARATSRTRRSERVSPVVYCRKQYATVTCRFVTTLLLCISISPWHLRQLRPVVCNSRSMPQRP